MNCEDFEEIISELARDRVDDQTMEANVHKHALIHLDECDECRVRSLDQRALTSCLDGMAREMRSFTTPNGVEEQLMAFFRQEFSAPVSSPVQPMNHETSVAMDRISRWNSWITATAAVLIIVLGVAVLRLYVGRQTQPRTSGPENAVAQAPPKESVPAVDVGTSSSPETTGKKLAPSRRTGSHRRARLPDRDGNAGSKASLTITPVANDTDNEVATHFMPLGYAGPINLQDGGQLVRVELPRSAMWSMGLPVNMDRYGERVKADVLLGADGLARAIRFVQ
jgi:hypothetical protein